MDAVITNGFSFEILSNFGTMNRQVIQPIEKIIYKNSNYYALSNNTIFWIKLKNDHPVRADAHIWYEGRKLGVWRMQPHSKLIVKNPAGTNKRLFVHRTSPRIGNLAHLWPDDINKGLLRIVFVPERDTLYDTMYFDVKKTDGTISRNLCSKHSDTTTPHTHNQRWCALSTAQYEDLIYGLPPIGDKRYAGVSPLSENSIDLNNITTMYARLVVDNDHTSYRRPYIGIKQAINHKIPPVLLLRHPSRAHTCSTDSRFKLSRKFWFDNFSSHLN